MNFFCMSQAQAIYRLGFEQILTGKKSITDVDSREESTNALPLGQKSRPTINPAATKSSKRQYPRDLNKLKKQNTLRWREGT